MIATCTSRAYTTPGQVDGHISVINVMLLPVGVTGAMAYVYSISLRLFQTVVVNLEEKEDLACAKQRAIQTHK